MEGMKRYRMECVKIEFGGGEAIMEWDPAQASAPIYVDGVITQWQTASARHRTALAVALAAAVAWPDEEWPRVPPVGSVPDEWCAGCDAWDDLSYEVQS